VTWAQNRHLTRFAATLDRSTGMLRRRRLVAA
jgi:hypothetical protein